MTTSTHLVRQRRFLPLFVTQLLGAFNDNLFKNAMVLYVVYSVYNSEAAEAKFSAVASALFIIPFFVLSALSGQLADMRDKAKIIRIVKFCEILIMLVGGAGLVLAWKGVAITTLAIPLMLCLLGIAVAGGMFVVPLYAFLTTFVDKSQTSRTIAANNIVNSGAMVIGSLVAMALSAIGLPLQEQVLLSAAMCVISALLGAQLYRSERAAVNG